MSINRCKNEQIMVYLNYDILLSDEKVLTFDKCNIINESQNHYAEWKKLYFYEAFIILIFLIWFYVSNELTLFP